MIKILFISTPYENLGIEYLSAVLKESGHEVGLIIDPCLFFNPYHRIPYLNRIFSYRNIIKEKIIRFAPDLICFSVMTDTYQWGLALATEIKNYSSASVVFGGIHPTLAPELVIQQPCVDYVCVGESEETLLELAGHLGDRQYCRYIQGLWSKDEGLVMSNHLRPLINDLDCLPMPDKDIYYRAAPIYRKEYFTMTGRGCVYACAFCCNQALRKMYGDNSVRRRSVDHCIRELIVNKRKYRFKFVWFMDDNFTFDLKWLSEFSLQYHKYVGVPFFCYSHPSDMSKEAAMLLKEAGCKEVGIGVESIEKKTGMILNRLNDRGLVYSSLRETNKNNMVSITENILGLPGEDENTIFELVDFYTKNTPGLIVFSWLKVFPGTALFETLLTEGRFSPDKKDALLRGLDNSLTRGGNYAQQKLFNKVACLLVLVPFLPKYAVRLLRRLRLYRLFFVSPNTLLCMIRMFRASVFSELLYGRRTYDAGAKISARIYFYFMRRKIVTVLAKRKNYL